MLKCSPLQLAQDVQAFKAVTLAEEGCLDPVVLATKLAAVGYRVAIRTAVGGGAGQEAFHNLYHTFLIVTKGDLHLTDYLIDPNFRYAQPASGLQHAMLSWACTTPVHPCTSLQAQSLHSSSASLHTSSRPDSKARAADGPPWCREQFSITARDATYTRLLEAVPAEFVGTKERLIPLIQLLAAEMAAAFDKCSVTCPPWRSHRSMLSKWVPAKVRSQAAGLSGVSGAALAQHSGACSGLDCFACSVCLRLVTA